MQIRILHLDENHPLLMEALASAGFANDEDYASGKAEIEHRLARYHGLVIRSRFPIDRTFIDAGPNLRFIARVGAGLENIDTEYAAEKSIALIAAPEGNSNAVAEHTLAMLLSLFNKLNAADREIRNGRWRREANRGHELDGKTVGIIGYGNMGKAFAKKLRGFDAEVLCHDILPHVGDRNAKQVSLEELRQHADVLSLHVPWTIHTDKMVDADFIAAMGKPFWLLNTSRGKNVVTADLVSALRSGKILGAGLDVLEFEKSSFEQLSSGDMPDAMRDLLQADNVLLSPHVAGWTFESHEKLARVIAGKIIGLFSDKAETEKPQPRVTGIGGLFFKAKDPEALKAWYKDKLGIPADQYGWSFWWKNARGDDGMTQWSVFAEASEYFAPSQKPFMQNLRVDDLDGLLERLRGENVETVGAPETHDYGKFAWIMDPEGNKIELWEPHDRAFL